MEECLKARKVIPNFILRKKAKELGITKEKFLELWNKDHTDKNIQIIGKDIAENIFNPNEKQINLENNLLKQFHSDINWDEELESVKNIAPFKYFTK
ncbi:hypothetical protein SJC03_58 [Bacteroides phage SJC03]|nr:hypothetical protein SJC03_58 [Bacteroides phage SJC03]